ncbi:hypothetical protein CN234_21635 [Sinorhizobium meliloti]|uniref:hypothetical protein n=1 Tax=Rhizobium meliloti TaxID=382 RepID=UPI000FDB4C00|nr:hypothetical protein [Sinorhizobium meliloti]TWB03211.1 hypothetical protein FB000_10468 [Ensifer sp. SEMIA 134]TWB39471.1 hypothetical protein FB001_103259 [Ensifer sp. SEMIA 135]RVG06614.1 hypothetical protein CN234_21635 [Sinorhizobium meliloti]RVL13238.1 hypothetical protein CN147_31680 [Sinorhizobium meliloti]RVP96722.1 hypothetical protein CN069_25770 [Sinorhizobium meliloti]
MRIIIAISAMLLSGCNAQTTNQMATILGQVAAQASSDEYERPTYTAQPYYTPPQPQYASDPTAYTEVEPINTPTATVSNQACYGTASLEPQTPKPPGAMAGGC